MISNETSEVSSEIPPATPSAQLDASVEAQLLPTESTPCTMSRVSVVGSASPSLSAILPMDSGSQTERDGFFKTPNTSSIGTSGDVAYRRHRFENDKGFQVVV